MKPGQALQVRKDLHTILTDYRDHLQQSLVEANLLLARYDQVSDVPWDEEELRLVLEFTESDFESPVSSKPITSKELGKDDAILPVYSELKELSDNIERTQRIKVAREKKALVDRLIECLPEVDTILLVETIMLLENPDQLLNNRSDDVVHNLQLQATAAAPNPYRDLFQDFAVQLRTVSNELSKVRRDGTCTDNDTLFKVLKVAAVILTCVTGIIPGLAIYATLNHFGFFNTTGENAVNAMDNTLKDLGLDQRQNSESDAEAELITPDSPSSSDAPFSPLYPR